MAETIRETINQSLRDQFETRWSGGDPVAIEEYLPDRNGVDYLPTLEELVRIDLSYRWRVFQVANGPPPLPLKDYWDRFPELTTPARKARLERWHAYLANTPATSPVHHETIADTPGPVERDRATVAPGAFPTKAPTNDISSSVLHESTAPALGAFGPYQLLSLLGEGGMGIVYRARQQGANRIVALKVVRSGRSSDGQAQISATAIDRFHTEARAAAVLQHENIIPVYDVGRVGDHFYYSMRLVEGRGLNEILREGPLENRPAAEYLHGITAGIAEAHRHGILHRDLKPHNVIIDQHTERPLVADFGLAKVTASDDQLTRTGEAIGTPSYMPPEQVSNAASVGPAADIYALGATLYHMLTGRPPFQAASTLATLRQVLYEEPVSPRTLNSNVDKDLETICLVCLQKEPSRRFASAIALQEDLQRYLNGEPIAARPIGRRERAIRWCRRNPLAASLSGLAASLALLAFLSILVGYRQTRAALAESERNFSLARSTVDELYTDVSEVDLLDVPGMQPLKEKLLTRALKYYQQLLKDREHDTDLSFELAANYFRVGLITNDIVSPRDAEPHFVRAIEIQQSLLAANPNDLPLQSAIGDSWNSLGQCRQRQGNVATAKEAFLKAREVRREMADRHTDAPEYRRKLANIDMNLGLLAAQTGDLDEAFRQYETAQGVRRRLFEEYNLDAVLRDLAKGAFNQGTLEFSRHAALLDQLATIPPTNDQTADAEATRLDNQRRELESNALGHLRDAANYFGNAAAQFEILVGKNANSLNDQFDLSVAHFMHGDALRIRGDFPAALTQFQSAHLRLEPLVRNSPDVDRFREQLVTLLIGQAQCQLTLGRQRMENHPDNTNSPDPKLDFADVEQALTTADTQLAFLLQKNIDRAGYHYDVSIVQQLLGETRRLLDDPAGARLHFERAKQAIEILSDEFVDNPAYAAQAQSVQQSLDTLP